jgi:hypothetical protein
MESSLMAASAKVRGKELESQSGLMARSTLDAGKTI